MGVVTILVGLAAFKFGFIAGITALSGGMYIILASLAGLGVSYGFLAIVKAQIDSRNALIFFNQNDRNLDILSEQDKYEPYI